MSAAGVVLLAFAGLGTGLSLIIAIGAQNAYVLRQGLRREHVGVVVAICALSDAILILAGVSGIGVIVERAPWLITVIRWGGAAFLIAYGLMAARRAMRADRLATDTSGIVTPIGRVVATTLALTWLNPHVYLDTVLLLGSIANSHGDPQRWIFAGGAAAGSLGWFAALGYGARLLSGVFARPRAWMVLDIAIAVIMITLGVNLIITR
ncbi:MAG: LysE/ArgO family amino acid transporter [Dermatophilaceae bacterium]|nr:amino acid transporter [Actinomycetales bacterium]